MGQYAHDLSQFDCHLIQEKRESMGLIHFEHDDCVCGRGYGCQTSWIKEDVGDKVPTLAPRSPGDSYQRPSYIKFG